MSTAAPLLIKEVRCPVGPRRLFLVLRLSGETPHVNDENLMELACADCRRSLERQGQPSTRVLHCFDFVGRLVQTKVVP